MQLTGSQIVVECLKEQGVDTVFGYPGGAILNVYDELYKHPEIKHVLSHRVIHAKCYEVVLDGEDFFLSGYQRIRVDELHKFPVSRLISRFFSLLLKPNYKTHNHVIE